MSQSPQQQQSTMDADTMLDVYIHDYLAKRKLIASAKVFEDEAKVPLNVRAIGAPRGFLFEWWTVFWDIFISRYKSNQGSMQSCSEATRVLQLLQQQQQKESQHQSQTVNVNTAVNGKNPWIAEASTPMKQDVPRQRYGENVGVVMNTNNSANHLLADHQKHALVHTRDISTLNSFNQNGQGTEGLSNGAHASGVLTNVPLKGWPVGRDHIQARAHQQQGTPLPPQRSYQGQIESQLHPPNERKRKQPLMPSIVANSSKVGNAVGVFSSSAGELSMPNSPPNDKINIDDFLNYGALDGNNDNNSFLSHPVKEPNVEPSNGFTFSKVGSVLATTSVDCCDISFDGKLVAIGGQDKKASLWCTSTRESKATFDGHSEAITDIRFSPSMLRLATSSHDKTIRIWDLENPGSSIKTFTGHTASVASLDFHPKKEDLICSCDESEIRYWTIKNVGCVKVTKGGANQVRFQSGVGKHLAAIVGKSVTLLDLENPHARKHVLKGHGSNVQSVCWDSVGEHLISVSEDYVKVWRIDSGGKANCIHDLSVPEKRFICGAFHPCYPSLVIIGNYQSMEIWNMTENKLMTTAEEPVSALAVSTMSGLIVSAGHNDNGVKLWK